METFRLFDLFFVLLGAVFVGILLYLLWGQARSTSKRSVALEKLTILIPFKNEANRLPGLIRCLSEALISKPHFNVKLLNDHSTDLSAQFIADLELTDQILLHHAGEKAFGKKAVLTETIIEISDLWVLIMDADTELPKYFFDHLEKVISDGDKSILIPISPIKRKGLVPAFFDLDFLSLHFAGLKSAALGRPLLANGACMLINRDAYVESMPFRNDWNEQSGDDVFAMFAIARRFGRKSISVSTLSNPLVLVSFPSAFRKLWRQRLRWIAKSGKIDNTWFKFVAISVLTIQISLIIAALLITQGYFSVIGIAMFFVVLIIEILFLAIATTKLNRKDLWIYIVPSVFIYPFYLLTLGIFSTFAKPKWK